MPLYIDKRVLVNGQRSVLSQDNHLNLDEYLRSLNLCDCTRTGTVTIPGIIRPQPTLPLINGMKSASYFFQPEDANLKLAKVTVAITDGDWASVVDDTVVLFRMAEYSAEIPVTAGKMMAELILEEPIPVVPYTTMFSEIIVLEDGFEDLFEITVNATFNYE